MLLKHVRDEFFVKADEVDWQGKKDIFAFCSCFALLCYRLSPTVVAQFKLVFFGWREAGLTGNASLKPL